MSLFREYRTVDKSKWGPGPWHDEPDKVQWKDEATGLPCLAVRNHYGNWCGYVGVPESHPWFGKDYNDTGAAPCSEHCEADGESPYHRVCTPGGIVDVHGGLTFADLCQPGDEAHSICHVPEPGEPDHVWWFGFDCGHYGDATPDNPEARHFSLFSHGTYRTLEYVRDQVTGLARQLSANAGPRLLINAGAA